MTIKDIETRSGMSRANIRFYEQEGLLSPQRKDNGYRDYSEEDLRQLQRILLLRTLGLSLEEIRAAQKGELPLDRLLEDRAAALDRSSAAAQQHAQLCRSICRTGAQYHTLDGRRWLAALEAEAPAAAPAPLKTDTYQKVRAPWRRFFARYFDLLLYSALWIALGLLLLQEGPTTPTGSAWIGLSNLVGLVIMVLAEPLLLSTWGTTPGKWLLGLSVRGNAGQKLGYMDAIYRTVQALWYGFGFFIPVYNLVRGYKCYYDCTDGKTLAWEWDSELQLRDEKPWRIAAMAGSVAALFGLVVLATALSAAPGHRGDMTVAEFADSYNRLARYHGIEVQLDEEGRWTQRRSDGGVVISMSDIEPPDFVCTEENGVMTGLSFTLTVEGDTESWVPVFTNRRILAVLAFVRAYDPTPLSNAELAALTDRLSADPFRSTEATVHGVEISWQLTAEGYREVDVMDALMPDDGEIPACTMIFTLEKVS